MSQNPFAALGPPARPAPPPARAGGGALARYTQASAAFAELRTPWGRSEAYADLVEQAWREGRFDDDDNEPGTAPLPPPAPAHPRRCRRRAVGGGAGPDPRPARRPRGCRGVGHLVRADRPQ